MWKQAQYLEMKENLVLSLQKYPFTRRSDEEKKGSWSLDQIARTFSLFAPPPPQICLAPAATDLNTVYIASLFIQKAADSAS